jgi:DNA-binding NarL/FixJ family response regulator
MAHGSASFIIRSGDLVGELLAAIRLMAEHRPFLSAEALRLLGGQRDSRLAERDLEVLRLLAHELSIKEIAQRLGLSDKTIYRIRHKLKRTLGVRNTESIVDAARQQGLLDTRE